MQNLDGNSDRHCTLICLNLWDVKDMRRFANASKKIVRKRLKRAFVVVYSWAGPAPILSSYQQLISQPTAAETLRIRI